MWAYLFRNGCMGRREGLGCGKQWWSCQVSERPTFSLHTPAHPFPCCLIHCGKMHDIEVTGTALPPSHISLNRNYYKAQLTHRRVMPRRTFFSSPPPSPPRHRALHITTAVEDNHRRCYPSTSSPHGSPWTATTATAVPRHRQTQSSRKYRRTQITLSPSLIEGCGHWGRHVTTNQPMSTQTTTTRGHHQQGASSATTGRRRGSG